MPKIDIDKIQIDVSTGYPPPFNKAVEGRSRKRLGREVTVPLLVLTGLCTAILGRTALLGGRIRHPEARAGFVAPATHDEEHERH